MRNSISLFLILTFLSSAHSQTNSIIAEVKMLGMGTCSSDSGITSLTYKIRKEIMRIDIKGRYADGSLIYQHSTQKMWVLYNFEKVYFSMTSFEMDSFNRKVEWMGQEMKAKYEAMDEKDKQNASILWKNGNPFDKEVAKFEKIKKTDSLVSQLLCQKYRAELSDKTVKYAYLNDFKTTGLKESELEILNKLADFLGTGINTLTGNMDLTAFRKWDEGGYPVFIKINSGGSICHETWVQSIYRANTEDADFTIPIEFGKRENPLGNL